MDFLLLRFEILAFAKLYLVPNNFDTFLGVHRQMGAVDAGYIALLHLGTWNDKKKNVNQVSSSLNRIRVAQDATIDRKSFVGYFYPPHEPSIQRATHFAVTYEKIYRAVSLLSTADSEISFTHVSQLCDNRRRTGSVCPRLDRVERLTFRYRDAHHARQSLRKVHHFLSPLRNWTIKSRALATMKRSDANVNNWARAFFDGWVIAQTSGTEFNSMQQLLLSATHRQPSDSRRSFLFHVNAWCWQLVNICDVSRLFFPCDFEANIICDRLSWWMILFGRSNCSFVLPVVDSSASKLVLHKQWSTCGDPSR